MRRVKNKSIKKLKVKDETNNSVKTFHDRCEIKKRTMNQNRKHFKKACSSKAHDHSTYQLLPNYSRRGKTCNGVLYEK